MRQKRVGEVKNLKSVEVCNHCGFRVSWGSGKFVNRIPDLNDILTRIYNARIFPLGDFVCEECDNNKD